MNKKIIIVGAGPGGLQLAYYLEKNNLQYLSSWELKSQNNVPTFI